MCLTPDEDSSEPHSRPTSDLIASRGPRTPGPLQVSGQVEVAFQPRRQALTKRHFVTFPGCMMAYTTGDFPFPFFAPDR